MKRHLFLILVLLCSHQHGLWASDDAIDGLLRRAVEASVQKNYRQSYRLLFQAQQMAEQQNNAEKRFWVLTNMGINQAKQYNYPDALGNFTKAYQIATKELGLRQELSIRNNIAGIYMLEGQTDKALKEYLKIYELLDRLNAAEKDREQPGPELRKHIAKLQKELDSTEEWRDFTTYFEQVNASFLARLRENHPGLTASELRFLSLVCIHLSGKEIAQLLHITPEYCKKRKQQIARKMGLATSGELYGYLVSLQS